MVIPQWRAGCIRVTHPCAGRRQLKQASTPLPLDLHVLSLSLAFILSQDQTLRCCYFFFIFSFKRQWPQRVLPRISYPFAEAGFFQELTPSSSFSTLGGYFFSSCTFLSLSIVTLSMFSGISSMLLSAALGSLRFSHRRKNFAKVMQIFDIPKFLRPFLQNFFIPSLSTSLGFDCSTSLNLDWCRRESLFP